MRRFNVLGVCAGQGVCLHPFLHNEQFQILGNIEPRSCFYDRPKKQWPLNFGNIPMSRTLEVDKRVDLIIGHPDCGHSSKLRLSRAKKNIDPDGNRSLLAFINNVAKYRPKIFIMENLPKMVEFLDLPIFDEIHEDYQLHSVVSSVSVWGNSQKSRIRAVIIGVRRDKVKAWFPKLNASPEPGSLAVLPSQFFELPVTENPKICHVRECMEKTCNMILGDRKKITYYEAWNEWNKREGKSKWFVGGRMTNQPGVNRNLRDKPPLTVRKQNRQFRTDGLVLSPREMADIQGIPWDFKLFYDENQKIYWINKQRLNVTKTMPYEIADWYKCLILEFLYESKKA